MEKIKELLTELNEQDLKALRADLASSKSEVMQYIEGKLKQQVSECVTCGKALPEQSFELHFGDAIKKKGAFCGLDCLEYFTTQLKVKQHERYTHTRKDVQ